MYGRPPMCPKCNGSEFRLSQTGFLRRIAALISLRPFRCTHCRRRVWRFGR